MNCYLKLHVILYLGIHLPEVLLLILCYHRFCMYASLAMKWSFQLQFL